MTVRSYKIDLESFLLNVITGKCYNKVKIHVLYAICQLGGPYIVKAVTKVLKMLLEAAEHKVWGHSFSLYVQVLILSDK